MTERETLLDIVFRGGLLSHSYISRRPWVCTRRYYSPRGWRCPRFLWTRLWNYNASGKAMSMHLSYPHGIPQACKRFVRLMQSDAACAMCLDAERPWRRMMAYPLGGNWAYVCSDACWDALDARRFDDEDDDE